MNQTILTYSLYHDQHKEVTDLIESLQYVKSVNQVVQIDSAHPEADRKTIVRVEIIRQECDQKLDSFLNTEFEDFWFEH